MFVRAFARTIRTLRSPHFLMLLVKSALLALAIFIIFLAAVGMGLRRIDVTGMGGWFEFFADIMITFGAAVLGWLLLPTILPVVAAFFQESIANTIERKDYPSYVPLAPARSFWREIWEDSRFVLLMLGTNLLFLPTYFIPVLNIFTYYGVNGYLIGREFFETASARHLGRTGAKQLRAQYPMPAFLCGLLIVACTNVPLLNLVSPFIGVAIMVHLYHLLAKPAEILPPPQQT